MSNKKQRYEEHRQECIRVLREEIGIKPGDTIYTTLRHVSRSGMYRVINLFVIKDNQPRNIDYWAAPLLEGYDTRHDGCKAGGCGMDMGFHLVYNLSCVLYYNYECIGERCPSNRHVNEYKSPRGKGVMHEDGYALHQRWM